jgi:predicted enzyme related to lactoylglutathione lyase
VNPSVDGIFGIGGQMPGHAVFYILVADVEATCADAEQLGGTVVSKHLDPGPGARGRWPGDGSKLHHGAQPTN